MKYQIIIVTSEHQISVKEYDNPSVPLEDFQKAVGGHIEIVRPAFLMPVNPFLLMVIDEEGKIKEKPENGLASLFYANPYDNIVGDVVICTRFNSDPTAEPDIYALDELTASKVVSLLDRLTNA